MTLLDLVSIVVVAANWCVLAYFVALNTSYLGLIALAVREFRHHLRRRPWAGLEDAYADPLTLGVSVVMPAYNEEAGVVEGGPGDARAAVPPLRGRRHRRRLHRRDLRAAERGVRPGHRRAGGAGRRPDPGPGALRTRPAAQLRAAGRGPQGHDGKTDALNTGLNVAQYPLVCMADADSILDPEALLAVAKPFGTTRCESWPPAGWSVSSTAARCAPAG